MQTWCQRLTTALYQIREHQITRRTKGKEKQRWNKLLLPTILKHRIVAIAIVAVSLKSVWVDAFPFMLSSHTHTLLISEIVAYIMLQATNNNNNNNNNTHTHTCCCKAYSTTRTYKNRATMKTTRSVCSRLFRLVQHQHFTSNKYHQHESLRWLRSCRRCRHGVDD